MEQADLSIPAVIGAIHSYNAVTLECVFTERTLVATPVMAQSEEFSDLSIVRQPLSYLIEEFPSLQPYIYTTVTNSLAKFFVSFLPNDPRIRDILWAFEPHLLRIWTILDEPDFELEKKIYAAERTFLEKMDDSCDFTVVYAFGKAISDIRPMGAVSVR